VLGGTIVRLHFSKFFLHLAGGSVAKLTYQARITHECSPRGKFDCFVGRLQFSIWVWLSGQNATSKKASNSAQRNCNIVLLPQSRLYMHNMRIGAQCHIGRNPFCATDCIQGFVAFVGATIEPDTL
jgi:hypothetical protein